MCQPGDGVIHGGVIDGEADACHPIVFERTSEARKKRAGEYDQQ